MLLLSVTNTHGAYFVKSYQILFTQILFYPPRRASSRLTKEEAKNIAEKGKRLCANIRTIFCKINQNMARSSLLIPLKYLFVLASVFSTKPCR